MSSASGSGSLGQLRQVFMYPRFQHSPSLDNLEDSLPAHAKLPSDRFVCGNPRKLDNLLLPGRRSNPLATATGSGWKARFSRPIIDRHHVDAMFFGDLAGCHMTVAVVGEGASSQGSRFQCCGFIAASTKLVNR